MSLLKEKKLIAYIRQLQDALILCKSILQNHGLLDVYIAANGPTVSEIINNCFAHTKEMKNDETDN